MRIVLATLVLLAGIGPALAYPNCIMRNGGTLKFGFGLSTGNITNADEMDFLVMQAGAAGIDGVFQAERTHLDCIKVLRRVNGRTTIEYYDSNWEFVE